MAVPVARFVTVSDFSLEPLQIATDKHTKGNLQGFINEYEYLYLRRILGDDLYFRFNADLSGSTPQHPKFVALLNGDSYRDCEDKIVIYDGLKDALRHFIWVEFVRTGNYKNTISGNVNAQNENSNVSLASEVSALCRKVWNKAAPMARAANYFINNFEDYEATASSIVLSSGTTYLVSISDTKYLKDGDTVTISGTDYVIGNLITNTSFTVESLTDISDTDATVEWDIFGQYDVEPIDYSFMNV